MVSAARASYDGPMAAGARDGGGASTNDLRARILAHGGSACADAELLGLLLDGGYGGGVARRAAQELLDTAGALTRLDRLEPEALRERYGRGASRRVTLMRAALELGRRASATVLDGTRAVRDAADVHSHFRGRLPQLEHEAFYALLLDGRNRVRSEIRVSIGTLTAALVHPRDVFGPALRLGAAAVVLVHNHPSGDPSPSAEDIELTERLRQVGELVGIRVLDHVVIGQGSFVSLADRLER